MNGLKQVEANKEAIILCSLKLRVCYNRVCYNQVLRYFSTNCKNRAKNKLVQIMKIELTKKLIFLLSQLSLVVSSVNTNQGQDQFCLDMTRGVICRNVNRTCLCTLVQLPTQNWIKLDFNFDSRNVILVRLLQTVIA